MAGRPKRWHHHRADVSRVTGDEDFHADRSTFTRNRSYPNEGPCDNPRRVALIRLVAALFAVYLPAAMLLRRFAKELPPVERAIQSATISLASLIFLSVLVSYINLDLVFVAWGLALAAAVWLRRGAAPTRRSEDTDWWLIAILGLVAVSRIIVALPHE